MTATTHTEVYRRFRGALSSRSLRFLPLFLAEVSAATKRKLPLVLVYGPTVIGTIVASFVVYAKAGLQQGLEGSKSMQAAFVVTLANQMLEVRQIVQSMNAMTAAFALVAVTLFGAGLVCEDRRTKAHLLYFSRPLTRLDYFLGKLLAAAFFGALAVLVPNLVICSMATLSSPGWSFLEQQGDVVTGSLLFGSLWVAVTSVLVLTVSSLASRKVFAMAGVFATLFFLHAVAGIVSEIAGMDHLRHASLLIDLGLIGEWLLVAPGAPAPEGIALAWTWLGALVALCLGVLALRLREMELAA